MSMKCNHLAKQIMFYMGHSDGGLQAPKYPDYFHTKQFKIVLRGTGKTLLITLQIIFHPAWLNFTPESLVKKSRPSYCYVMCVFIVWALT